jgi:hypothetical protein
MAIESHVRSASQLVSEQQTWLRGFGIALAVGSALAGWFMREFYDWTGADQSRPAPVVGWIALSIAIADVVMILGLFFLHLCSRQKPSDPSKKNALQYVSRSGGVPKFSLRQLLGAVTMVALLLIIGRLVLPLVIAWIAFASTLAWAIWIGMRNAHTRWRIALILWLQFTPYLWLARKPERWNEYLELLGMLPALPAFCPSIFLNALFRYPFQSGQWISVLLSSLTFAIGIWVVRQGPKRSLAYSFIVLTFSIFGSFILHALMRA